MQVNGKASTERSGVAEEAGSFDGALDALRGDVRRVLKSARRVVRVEAQRFHLFAVETFFRAAFYICLLGFALTASISASLFVVRGIRSALMAWSGAEWIGELGAGVVVLGVIGLGALAVRVQLTNKLSRRLRRSMLADASPELEPERAPRTAESKT